MVKKALCVGINHYPGTGNDLGGCVNDAKDWAGLLKTTFGFKAGNTTMLLDDKATRKAITDELEAMLTSAAAGDIVVFTFSGHGTWRPDTNGDESDGRDEAICAYDGIIIDDDVRTIIAKMKEGVHFTFISDSCHSGSVTRQMLERSVKFKINSKGEAAYIPKPKFMPPEVAAELYGYKLPKVSFSSLISSFFAVMSGFLALFKEGPEVMLSGCKDDEYSFDAYIGGRRNGAFTAIAIKLMKQSPGTTYERFHQKLRSYLPSPTYQQSPQLRGSLVARKRKLFT